MAQIVEDRLERHTLAPEAHAAREHRTVHPFVLAVGALAVAGALAFGVRALSDGGSSTSPGSFAAGSTIAVRVDCGASGTSCDVGAIAPDGSQWYWITPVGAEVPTTWASSTVEGQLHVPGAWGTATFTAGGRSIDLVGGRATPEHSLFG